MLAPDLGKGVESLSKLIWPQSLNSALGTLQSTAEQHFTMRRAGTVLAKWPWQPGCGSADPTKGGRKEEVALCWGAPFLFCYNLGSLCVPQSGFHHASYITNVAHLSQLRTGHKHITFSWMHKLLMSTFFLSSFPLLFQDRVSYVVTASPQPPLVCTSFRHSLLLMT